MFRTRLLPVCLLPLAFTFTSPAALAAGPADAPDFEIVTPAPARAPKSLSPSGLEGSPLNVTTASGKYPRRRFVLRDGTMLIAQVLGFDGAMYALRLPHGTLLARQDLFSAITPVPEIPSPVRLGRTHSPHRASASRARFL